MKTFFSGTDSATLVESVVDYGFPLFLSMITNDKLEIIAKAALKGIQVSKYNSVEYIDGKYRQRFIESEEEVVFTFDCNIIITPNSRYSKDIELSEKYYKEKKSREIKSVEERRKAEVSDYWDSDFFKSQRSNKGLRPLTDFVDLDQLPLFSESNDDKPLQRRVFEFVLYSILLDDDCEDNTMTLEAAIAEISEMYSEKEDKELYPVCLNTTFANLFEVLFTKKEISSVISLTEIEKKIKELLENNSLLSNPECVFIKESMLKTTSNFINNLRKELINK